jgi:hypothetical protein
MDRFADRLNNEARIGNFSERKQWKRQKAIKSGEEQKHPKIE